MRCKLTVKQKAVAEKQREERKGLNQVHAKSAKEWSIVIREWLDTGENYGCQ